MDDMIYRNNSIAEENIDPNGHPAKNGFEEWSEGVVERTDLGYKDEKVKSAQNGKADQRNGQDHQRGSEIRDRKRLGQNAIGYHSL